MSSFLVCILACISVVRDKHDKNMASRKCVLLASQWGYSRFQVTGMIKGVLGCEILNFRIFLGWKISQVSIFGVA